MKKLIFYSLMLIYINSFGQLNIGDVAPEFKLKNVDSSYYSLNKNSESKGFIIIFTCNHCPFSQAYEERIIELDKKYKKLGFPVVAINPNDPVKVPEDSFEKMVKQYKEKKFTFPYLHDETQQTAKAYGATRTPHVFILVKENKNIFRVKYIGAIDNDTENENKQKTRYVENAINNILKGKEPDIKETKAIGCSIKWKT